jgi:hypothetical protein
MDLIRPDRGTATLLGLDPPRNSLEIKRRVGYLPGGTLLLLVPAIPGGLVAAAIAERSPTWPDERAAVGPRPRNASGPPGCGDHQA